MLRSIAALAAMRLEARGRPHPSRRVHARACTLLRMRSERRAHVIFRAYLSAYVRKRDPVITNHAGLVGIATNALGYWTPAFAGMTVRNCCESRGSLRLDAGALDHLGPFLGLGNHEGIGLSRREHD